MLTLTSASQLDWFLNWIALKVHFSLRQGETASVYRAKNTQMSHFHLLKSNIKPCLQEELSYGFI